IGVDTDRFRPAPDGRTGRAALGVGVVARLKRWEIAARAARDAGWSFRLVGPTPDGPYAEELRSLGPGVELLGEVTDEELRKEFGRADVLLHPSRVEVLAGTVLQGLASALPVLGAEPVADLVEPGVTGWTTPARAPDDEVYGSFVEWLGRLSDPQLRRTMGAAARISAETRFSWESVVRAHVTLYEDVFGAAARP
ncbi:MAG TPA: glycosyltransferase, partial [Thermoplasmata archaeon]|nr:glycosyltransferase [Thermoplasmata archaeon]